MVQQVAQKSRFSDADIKSYTTETIRVETIAKQAQNAKTTETIKAARAQQVQAVTASGLTVEKYNAIASALQHHETS